MCCAIFSIRLFDGVLCRPQGTAKHDEIQRIVQKLPKQNYNNLRSVFMRTSKNGECHTWRENE